MNRQRFTGLHVRPLILNSKTIGFSCMNTTINLHIRRTLTRHLMMTLHILRGPTSLRKTILRHPPMLVVLGVLRSSILSWIVCAHLLMNCMVIHGRHVHPIGVTSSTWRRWTAVYMGGVPGGYLGWPWVVATTRWEIAVRRVRRVYCVIRGWGVRVRLMHPTWN